MHGPDVYRSRPAASSKVARKPRGLVRSRAREPLRSALPSSASHRARPRLSRRARTASAGTDRDVPIIDREGAIAPLRLAIGKDGLGIELAGPATVECLDVVELVVRLPHVKFPFDVSGGVAKFRHKRGELERVGVELDARRVARWAEPRLRGLLSPGPCTVIVEPRAFGATVTVHRGRQSAARRSHAARGARLRARARADARRARRSSSTVRAARISSSPATALAIRAVAALVGDAARREGARFVMPRCRGPSRAASPAGGRRACTGLRGHAHVGLGRERRRAVRRVRARSAATPRRPGRERPARARSPRSPTRRRSPRRPRCSRAKPTTRAWLAISIARASSMWRRSSERRGIPRSRGASPRSTR